jgi:hypothetical protein
MLNAVADSAKKFLPLSPTAIKKIIFKTELKQLFNRVKIKIQLVFLGLLKQSKTIFFST